MIDNWPPAKGPKPRHLAMKLVYQEVASKRTDFSFEFPLEFKKERRAMLDAIMEYEPGQRGKEKISRSSFHDDGADELRGERVLVGERMSLAHHVQTLSTLTHQQASRMIYGASKKAQTISEMLTRPAQIRLTYPLSRGVLLEVRPFIPILRTDGFALRRARRMTVGHVLWTVAHEYLRIYADWKRYGVWGHAFEDLYFEAMTVKKGGVVDLVVGSR